MLIFDDIGEEGVNNCKKTAYVILERPPERRNENINISFPWVELNLQPAAIRVTRLCPWATTTLVLFLLYYEKYILAVFFVTASLNKPLGSFPLFIRYWRILNYLSWPLLNQLRIERYKENIASCEIGSFSEEFHFLLYEVSWISVYFIDFVVENRLIFYETVVKSIPILGEWNIFLST